MIPANKSLLIAVLLCLFCSGLLPAQTIRQSIEDHGSSQTTTVIKESQSNSDQEVLSQLDIDEYGMHQVVRITTEGNTTPETSNKRTTNIISQPRIADAGYSQTASPIQTQLPEQTWQQKQITSKNAAKVKTEKVVTVPQQSVQKKGLQAPSRSGSYPVYSGKKRMKNPRFKKKKRKRNRNNKRCPVF